MPEPANRDPSTATLAIVTASDQTFVPLLEGWLGSLAKASLPPGTRLFVVDLGLQEQTRIRLEARGVTVIGNAQIVDTIGVADLPLELLSVYIRPFLPRLVPGFDILLWIDSDCWIQTGDAIARCVEAVRGVEFACCAEADRNYLGFWRHDPYGSPAFGSGNIESYLSDLFEAWLARHFSADLGHHLRNCPLLNTGVLCMWSQSPVWDGWRDFYLKAIAAAPDLHSKQHAKADFMLELLSFNGLVRSRDYPFNVLPATFNWLIHLCYPALSATGLLIEPNYPYAPIDIVHLSAGAKWRDFKLNRHSAQGRAGAALEPHSVRSPHIVNLRD